MRRTEHTKKCRRKFFRLMMHGLFAKDFTVNRFKQLFQTVRNASTTLKTSTTQINPTITSIPNKSTKNALNKPGGTNIVLIDAVRTPFVQSSSVFKNMIANDLLRFALLG